MRSRDPCHNVGPVDDPDLLEKYAGTVQKEKRYG